MPKCHGVCSVDEITREESCVMVVCHVLMVKMICQLVGVVQMLSFYELKTHLGAYEYTHPP